MRRAILCLALLALPVSADDGFLAGDKLLEAAGKCADGCVLMTREEVMAFQIQIAMALAAVEAAARKEGEKSCRNAI
ncbi:MAG: hypothetical protein WC023_06235 [Rhodocyclaceae bacterium]